MAKLKCDLHKRRVFFIKGVMIHRGGWGDVCPGKTATIGKQMYTPGEVEKKGMARSVSPDKSEDLNA